MTISIQTIQDGPRNAIIKLLNDEGTTETLVLKVDVSTLSPDPLSGECTEVRIERIWFSITAFGIEGEDILGSRVELFWDATIDVPIITLTQGNYEFDFRPFGGLVNNAGAGKTGDILLTFPAAVVGNSYTIVLGLLKGYAS